MFKFHAYGCGIFTWILCHIQYILPCKTLAFRYKQSAVADHSTTTKHSISFDKMEVTINILNYHPCIIRESVEITRHPHNFNHDDDYRLSKIWLHLFCQTTHPPSVSLIQWLKTKPSFLSMSENFLITTSSSYETTKRLFHHFFSLHMILKNFSHHLLS